MAANIYILSACDAWAEHSSMRILGVTTDENMLYAMLAVKIKAGDMEYDGSSENAWSKFQKDFKNGDVNFNKLKYGFVQTYEDMQITEPISLAQFPEAGEAYEEITGAKVRADMERLGLDHRSLVYSVVEVHTDSGETSFYMPESVTATLWKKTMIILILWMALTIPKLMSAYLPILLEPVKASIDPYSPSRGTRSGTGFPGPFGAGQNDRPKADSGIHRYSGRRKHGKNQSGPDNQFRSVKEYFMDEKLSRNGTYSLMFRGYPDVVNVKQLCEMLGGISTKTACRLLQENKIEHFKIGRIYKIPKIHVLKYLKVEGYFTEKEHFNVVKR